MADYIYGPVLYTTNPNMEINWNWETASYIAMVSHMMQLCYPPVVIQPAVIDPELKSDANMFIPKENSKDKVKNQKLSNINTTDILNRKQAEIQMTEETNNFKSPPTRKKINIKNTSNNRKAKHSSSINF